MTTSFVYECLDSVDSTNTYLKEHPKLWNQNFYTLRAINQTNGRGRHGRNWFSGKNNLTFSFIFNSLNLFNTLDISSLTIYAGLVLRNALSRISKLPVLIKWPNDITYQNKKLCGILTEMVQIKESKIVIIGIGVNLNTDQIPEELLEKTTSLKDITKKDFSPELVLNEIMNDMVQYLPTYNLPFSESICAEFAANCDRDANLVTLVDKNTKSIIRKKFDILGINEHGLLSVIDENGNHNYINANELEFNQNPKNQNKDTI
ncbi:MAG: biotin--[acetyl-CoA-carboxylase] ligase [Spirochaetia bacterium]|nr:biotin--[acetyl-CoA-carboxylase] ligase [Spirochaetia bacterium]